MKSRRRRRFKLHSNCDYIKCSIAFNLESKMTRIFTIFAILNSTILVSALENLRHQSSLTANSGTMPLHLQSSVSQLNFNPTISRQNILSSSSSNVLQDSQRESSNISQKQTQSHIMQLCSQLNYDVAKQLKLCKLIGHSAEARAAVAAGATKGLEECRNQFSAERWNCTHASGEHHLLTGDFAQSFGNRESGFIHAITAAGIVYSIATACSLGSLSDCACDKTRIGVIPRQQEIWKWGGCSDNIRYGMIYAKHLVELLDAVHQARSHNNIQQDIQAFSDTRQQNSPQAFISYSPSKLTQTYHKSTLTKRSLRVGQQSYYNQHLDGTQLGASYSSQQQRSSFHLSHHHNHNLPQYRHLNHPQHLMSLSSSDMASTHQSALHNTQPNSFCQKDRNITQSTHIQLIKSLLSKNSLEKHHEFRLAMNMHNNKVGRMVSNYT